MKNLLYHPSVLVIRRPRFSKLARAVKEAGFDSFSVLDVGVANSSQSEWLSIFDRTRLYDGIDLVRPCDFVDKRCGDGDVASSFYHLDLNRDVSSEFLEPKYDVICVSHVLEHLRSPYSVVSDLVSLLRPGGLMYLEYPNLRSIKRSWVSSYDFYGDSTHVQPVNTALVIESCRSLDVQILDYGLCLPAGKLVFSTFASLVRLMRVHPGWRDPLLFLAGMVDFVLIKKPLNELLIVIVVHLRDGARR